MILFWKTIFNDTPFDKKFLARYLAYSKNQLYTNKKIQLTQQRLNNSGYFQQAQITPDLAHSSLHHVNISITLTPVTARNYILGLGYGTDTGIQATGTTIKNYTGKFGDKINLTGQISSLNTNINLQYLIPSSKPYQSHYIISSAFSKISQVSGKSEAIKLSGQLHNTHGHWDNVYSLNVLNERYSYTTLPVNTNANLLYPSVKWQYTNQMTNLTSHGFLAQVKLYVPPVFYQPKGLFLISHFSQGLNHIDFHPHPASFS